MRTLRRNLQAPKARDKGAAVLDIGIAVGLIAVASVMVVGVLSADLVSAFGRAESPVAAGADAMALAA